MIMKKFISAVLTLALIIGLMPGMTLTASASSGGGPLTVTEHRADGAISITYGANSTGFGELSGKCGANLTWTLDTSTGLLEISGTGPMDDWRGWNAFDDLRGRAPWYAHRASIKNARISEGVTTIGSDAFYRVENIITVDIPASVTRIGRAAFAYSGITNITIPSTVKTLTGSDLFRECRRLESVTIGVENFGWSQDNPYEVGLFCHRHDVTSLKSVTILGSVKTIPGGSFYANESLETVRIEEGVTTLGGAEFAGCTSLSSVTLPNSLTTIGEMAFFITPSLTSVTIPKNVTSIGMGAFRDERRIITLRGYTGSAAQTHANIADERRYGVRFEAITGDLPDVLPGGTTTPPAPPPPAQEIKVLVNGSTVTFDQPPIIENGRTLVPLRAIFEALGATVEWEQSTQTVTAVKDDITITLKIGDAFLTKNGERIALDVPAKIVGGRTLVPARAVAESFGADVQWDQATRTVTITE